MVDKTIKIVKRSFHLSWKNKFLWIFGLFASYGISSASYNFSYGGGDGQSAQTDELAKQIYDLLTSSPLAVYGVLAIIILILLIFYIFSILSQASLVCSIKGLNEGKRDNFWQSLKIGKGFFWRLLWYKIVVFMVYLLVIIGAAAPLVVLLLTRQWLFSALVGLLLFFFIIFILVVLTLSARYGLRSLIFANKKGLSALLAGWQFLKANYKQVLLLWLLQYAIYLGATIIILVFVLALGLVLTSLGIGLYLSLIHI